ncbi:hypothetical protein [Enterococcus sp. AZ109]|uniref:hypothetical protein n=1 Tax=Enterococcus sp. AZ109 TaxID=2774634 RepID=UPI003F28A67F
MSKKNRRILLIISLVFLSTLGYFGYQRWHYERANAFYLSYKKHESLVKQQEAFVNNIDSEVMEKLDIDFTYKDRTHELYGMSITKDNKEYTFYPLQNGELNVGVIDKNSLEELCAIRMDNDLKDSHPITGKDTKNFPKYRDEAMEIYRNIFKEVYENWEIK